MHAQIQVPPVFALALDYWRFDSNNTNLLSANGYPPIAATNVQIVPTSDGGAAKLDSSEPSLLQYRNTETGSRAMNLTIDEGSVLLDLLPRWTTTNNGGTGPGVWSRIFEADFSTNAVGWLRVFLNPEGTLLYFCGEANGVQTNYVSAQVNFSTNQSYQVVVTYSSDSTAVFLDGQLLGTGPGLMPMPSTPAREGSFRLGSDSVGENQARALFKSAATFFYPLGVWEVANIYAATAGSLSGNSVSTNPVSGNHSGFPAGSIQDGPMETGLSLSSDNPSPPGGGTGGQDDPPGPPPGPQNYPTNSLWIEILTVKTNVASLVLHGTAQDMTYEILSKENLSNSIPWVSEGTVLGAANQDWTPANVTLGARTNRLFLWARSWVDSDGDGLPDWWELANGLDPNNPDTGNTGIPDSYKNPIGDGWNNLYKYEHGMNPGQFYTPPPPKNVMAQLDATGTNVVVSWESGGGPVTQYAVVRVDDQTATTILSSNTFTFHDYTSVNLTTSYSGGPSYQIRAYFPGGATATSQPVTVFRADLGIDVQLFRGPLGKWEIGVPAPVPNLSTIRLIPSGPAPFAFLDIYSTNLVNGVAPLPTNQLPEEVIGVKELGTNGLMGYSPSVPIYVAPESTWFHPIITNFINASAHLKENLKFLLRSATVTLPFEYAANIWTDGYHDPLGPELGDGAYPQDFYVRPASPTNYEYSGFHVFSANLNYPIMHLLRPVAENYLWRNFVFNSADGYDGYSSDYDSVVDRWVRTLMDPVFEYSGSATNPPVALTNASFAWSYYGYYSSSETDALAEGGMYVDGNNHLFLGNNVYNAFGLRINSAHFLGNDGQYTTLTAGGSGTVVPVETDYFLETDVPTLQTEGYYFTPGPFVTYYQYLVPQPIPGSPGFAVTNASPPLIASIGQPMTFSGWAKQRITNSHYSNKFAYLEQYFDQALQIDPNGNITTNSAGPVSPYGEFFPTFAGEAALVTMPDIETGQRGTGVVNVLKLQLDVNHDGVMDLSFGGPDNTSAVRPMIWWVNDDRDYSNDTTDVGHEVLLMPTDGILPLADCIDEKIQSQRDLEDFARLWVCGLPKLPATNGYAITLSMSASSGSPAINLYAQFDTNGSPAYLTDTNAAAAQFTRYYLNNQLSFDFSKKLSTISPNQSYTVPVYTDGTPEWTHFLFEGCGIGRGQLVLTVSKNGTNILCQTSAWFDLRKPSDIFDHAHVESVITAFPSMRTNGAAVSTFKIDSQTDAALGDAKQLIVQLHGWNNNPEQSENYAETMFKRLYWAGYQGRFVALRWPALTGVLSYNRSELVAFRSAGGASACFDFLRSRYPDFSINAAAHSMGNIVMMEALRLQAASGSNALNNYVLMEAASPAHCYDTNTSLCPGLVAEESDHPTPNTYYGYPGAINAALRGTMVNFFNTNDFALAAWVGNQLLQKPESDLGYYIAPGVQPYFIPSILVTDPREIMAFCARPRTYAVGAQPGVHGVIGGTEVDMHVQFGFGDTAADHSGQYTRSIQQVHGFYSRLLEKLDISQP
jgi:hypothetical protein